MIILSEKFLDLKSKIAGFKVAGFFAVFFIVMREIPSGFYAVKRWKTVLNHERIHQRQCWEMLVLPFLLAYGGHYIWNRLRGLNHYKAYKGVIFEKEANTHEDDFEYLSKRPWFNCFKEDYPEYVQ